MAVEQAIAAPPPCPPRPDPGCPEAAGCDDDAQLAFTPKARRLAPALRYATAAARRAAELACTREAAAQFERAPAVRGRAAPGTAASLWDGLAYEAGLLDRWQ